jgi:hypothetical protein
MHVARLLIYTVFVSFSSPSPSSKHKQVVAQEEGSECCDEFSSGSLAGSLASGSSGFGSLSKKRQPLFPSGMFFITVCSLSFWSYFCQDSVTSSFADMFASDSSGLDSERKAFLFSGVCMHKVTIDKFCSAISLILKPDKFPEHCQSESLHLGNKYISR